MSPCQPYDRCRQPSISAWQSSIRRLADVLQTDHQTTGHSLIDSTHRDICICRAAQKAKSKMHCVPAIEPSNLHPSGPAIEQITNTICTRHSAPCKSKFKTLTCQSPTQSGYLSKETGFAIQYVSVHE